MKTRINFPLPEGGRLVAAFSRPRAMLRAETAAAVPETLTAVEAETKAGHWVVGFVAYEAAQAFDTAFRCHDLPAGQPYALFAVFDAPDPDHSDHASRSDEYSCTTWQSIMPVADAEAGITDIRSNIRAGEYYQVNFATRLKARFSGAPSALFAALEESQPEAYRALIDWDDGQVLSVSPELFFARAPGKSRDDEFNGKLTTRPMKGTAPRHADPLTDRAAAHDLRASAKEQAENLMIVDLLRNDLARIAQIGSVKVERLFDVEPWPSVWQMTSTITALPRAETDLLAIFSALFPCGSITGAPKVASMHAIRALEPWPRSVYCGAIGLLCPDGRAIFSVGIRTVEILGNQATCGIGSGITIDSRADAEIAEWHAKSRFLHRASAPFELLETLLLRTGDYWLLDRHLARLAASAEHFGFVHDPTAIREALRKQAVQQPEGDWRVRLRVSRDGTPHTEAFALPKNPEQALIQLATAPIDGRNEFLRHKTTERSAYAPHGAFPPGVFDILLYNNHHELTEFTRGNLIIERNGEWLTPAASCGLLPGVLRAELIAQGKLREAVLRVEEITTADKMYFINSVRGILPVATVPDYEPL